MTRQHVFRGADGAERFIRSFLTNRAPNTPVFLVADARAYSGSGASDRLEPFLSEQNVVRFSGFSVDPKLDEVRTALAHCRAASCGRVLAVGGGTAMDIAKLVRFFASSGADPEAYLQGLQHAPGPLLPLLAVPTTAGTGSEATRFAVLYVGNTKHSVDDPGLKPSHVWLNPDHAASLPPYSTACCGFDALAHAVESCWSCGASARSCRYSLDALRLCLLWLERNVLQPTPESRRGMMEAAHLAGRAIDQARTTAAHALSYSLTAHERLPHGHAVALILPAVCRWNLAGAPTQAPAAPRRRMKQLVRLFDATGDAEAAVARLSSLRASIGLGRWPGQAAASDRAALLSRLEREVNFSRLANNPVPLSAQDLRQVISDALGGL